MWVGLSSATWDDLDLGDYAERYLIDAFSSVPNVGRILVGGLRAVSYTHLTLPTILLV